MRFIVDECVGPKVATWLRQQGHDVFSVYEQSRGIDDEAVLDIAFEEKRILVTNDKDFGEKVYRDKVLHHGIILLRLADQSAASKIAAIEQLLRNYSDRIEGSFAVLTERQVRFGSVLWYGPED
jgi:predicted nuclease of predicted toxin-antitoxin system